MRASEVGKNLGGTGNRTLVLKGRLGPTFHITYRRSLDAGG